MKEFLSKGAFNIITELLLVLSDPDNSTNLQLYLRRQQLRTKATNTQQSWAIKSKRRLIELKTIVEKYMKFTFKM